MTTWFSRLPNRWGDDRYAIHQAIWQAFPLNHGEDQPFIFRVETDSVLVRSRVNPFWTDPSARSTQEYTVWALGATGRLNLHLNVHRRDGGKNLPVRGEDVLPFVGRTLTSMGVEVEEDDINVFPFVTFARDQVVIYPVRVDARIRVVDTDRLAKCLRTGVGRAKYLGFGLPIIHPPDAVL